MNKRRRISAVLLWAGFLLLSLSISASAGVTKKEGLRIAKKLVPSHCTLNEISLYRKKQQWEYEFFTKDRKIEYEIRVDRRTGEVKKQEMENKADKGGRVVGIRKSVAEKAVRKLFRDAVVTRSKKCMDGGFYIFRVWFRSDAYTGNAEVNAKTGRVIEWTKFF